MYKDAERIVLWENRSCGQWWRVREEGRNTGPDDTSSKKNLHYSRKRWTSLFIVPEICSGIVESLRTRIRWFFNCWGPIWIFRILYGSLADSNRSSDPRGTTWTFTIYSVTDWRKSRLHLGSLQIFFLILQISNVMFSAIDNEGY